MKITKAELDRCWAATMGDDWYWDDLPPDFENYDQKAPATVLNLRRGDVACIWQGADSDPTQGEGRDLYSVVRKWQKAQTTAVLTFEIPKDKIDEVQTVLAALGGKQIGGQS